MIIPVDMQQSLALGNEIHDVPIEIVLRQNTFIIRIENIEYC